MDYFFGEKRDGKRNQPSINKASSRLALNSGGIAAPDSKLELRLVSASVVGVWASSASTYRRMLGVILADPAQLHYSGSNAN